VFLSHPIRFACTTFQLHVAATFHPCPPVVEGKEQLNDFVFIAPSPNVLAPVPFMQRPARMVAKMDMPTRKKHLRLLEEMGADDDHMKSYVPDDKVPIRQYFHSKTYQPMVGRDWDVDSDEDSTTDQWLQDITTSVSRKKNGTCVL